MKVKLRRTRVFVKLTVTDVNTEIRETVWPDNVDELISNLKDIVEELELFKQQSNGSNLFSTKGN